MPIISELLGFWMQGYWLPNTVVREFVVVNGVVRTEPVAVKKYRGGENVKVNRTPLPIGGNS